jgi:phosphoribosylcarboxyaminoimidazole (NCAIR) mutase
VQLLTEELLRSPLHIVLGSESDKPVGDRIRTFAIGHGSNPPMHVISCHRHPEATRLFAQQFVRAGRSALIMAGGKSYQAPAVMASWLLHFGNHVAIWGIPIGDTREKRQSAFSAMHDVPGPCLVHAMPDDSDESIERAVKEALGYIHGTFTPGGERDQDWEARLALHCQQAPKMAIR